MLNFFKNFLFPQIKKTKNLVETFELDEILKRDLKTNRVRVLDCSWYLPLENKNARALYNSERIPYAQMFEMDEIADKSSGLPHMMPTNEMFIKHMKEMDIRKNDHIICYDQVGMFSAPRVWFTFKVFGAPNVSILNGGLPKWKSEKLPLETGDTFGYKRIIDKNQNNEDFDYKIDNSKIVNMREILKLSLQKKQKLTDEYIVDCRSPQRYNGEVEEPRPTKRKGHVDTADNVFFKDLLDQNSCFKSPEQIKAEFAKRNIDLTKPMTLYCGSGATACVDIFALSLLGKYDNIRLYDGSWGELGNITEDQLNEILNSIKV